MAQYHLESKIQGMSLFGTPYISDINPIDLHQDVDINDLCTEFTNKAKCDGTKVVLEPQGVNCILKNLTAPKK